MFRRKWWIILLVVILVLGAAATMFLRFSPHSWSFDHPMMVEGCEDCARYGGTPWTFGRMPRHAYPTMGRMMPFGMGGYLFYGAFRFLLLIAGIVLLVRLIRGPHWHHHPGHRFPHHGWREGPYPGHPHDEKQCPECEAQNEEEVSE